MQLNTSLLVMQLSCMSELPSYLPRYQQMSFSVLAAKLHRFSMVLLNHLFSQILLVYLFRDTYKFSYTHALSHNVLFGICYATYGFPCGSVVKNLTANAGDMDLIPGPGRSLGEGNGNPLQYSCLENPMDRGTWWITVHGVHKDSNVTWWLNKNKCNIFILIHVHIPAHE